MSEDRTPRLYGVSTGNGNDGVSRMFADYYVTTDAPWRLAKLAALSQFKAGKGRDWAQRNVDIDGDSEFGISATFSNPPCDETEDGEYPEVDNPEDAEDGRNWSDGNGAWLIVEIFPEDEPHESRPSYDSLADAFTSDVLAIVPESWCVWCRADDNLDGTQGAMVRATRQTFTSETDAQTYAATVARSRFPEVRNETD